MAVATALELGDPDVAVPALHGERPPTEAHASGPQLQGVASRELLLSGGNYLSEQATESDIYVKDGTVDLKGRPAIRAKSGGWKACPFILGNECCERLAYYGIGTNLVMYLRKILHQGNASAANNVTNFSGTAYITPLIGAFFADAYWGRFWTIAVFSTIYCLGMILLTIAASVHSLKPPACANQDNTCKQASSVQIGVFYLALYMIALGTGGIKPCVSSFGADQFDDEDPGERKKKTSFFNWFYFSINVGALISSSVLVYIQDNVSWGWGFGIPAAAMGMAIVSFFIGSPRYRHQKPKGSPLTRIAQVFVSAFRNWQVKVPADENMLHEVHDKESAIKGSRKVPHTKEFRFLDKAAVVANQDQESPWRLCTVTQIEEVKIIIRILPIWASSIVFSTVYSQMSTLFVEQGSTMNAHMGPNFKIPPAALSIFDTLSVIVWVPIYDRLLVPIVRRFTGNERGFTQLQRMGIGLFISMFSMIVAAIVEIKRLHIAKHHGLLDNTTTPVPLSIFWQVPQYFLIGASEIFTFIGQLEFFYDQAPDGMRSLMSALSLATVSLGSYLSTLLVTIVTKVTRHGSSPGWIPDNLNRGHIDYFFWLLAIMSALNILFYLACAHWYKYKKVAKRIVPQ
ncbi:hypothetical protein O6H91_09G024300 [Diphasiastrum complanatum]|uniref:Uncharacterized protein n=1 Tax=Diphasiastrum complanatum TaxID=34168 RepID=A0ACC2CMB2_DIPCM|nr:hypothetical protein O6H91_09G024300 [Diphasiastrum complanatum]